MDVMPAAGQRAVPSSESVHGLTTLIVAPVSEIRRRDGKGNSKKRDRDVVRLGHVGEVRELSAAHRDDGGMSCGRHV